MMKSYGVYGNCQIAAISHYLNTHEKFSDSFVFNKLIPVHTMLDSDIDKVRTYFKNNDLLIHQVISENYKIFSLSTNELMQYRKENSRSITFPSLFFSAYSPHCGPYKGIKSILNLLHDYIILYCYARGMNERETLDLISREDLYPKQTSLNLLDASFINLQKRELSLDIKISTFIKKHYQSVNLFPHYQHPIDIVSVHIVNEILKLLSYTTIDEPSIKKISLSNVSTPIYRSTYQNLECSFDANFTEYQTINGSLEQDEVICELFKTYRNLEKKDILLEVKKEKPFITSMFNESGI